MTALPAAPEGLTLATPGADEEGMFRSAFGDPRPRTLAQILEVMEEKMVDASDFYEVQITDSTGEAEDSVFHGWTADFLPNEGDDGIETGGWPTREALVADLKELGIYEHLITDVS